MGPWPVGGYVKLQVEIQVSCITLYVLLILTVNVSTRSSLPYKLVRIFPELHCK